MAKRKSKKRATKKKTTAEQRALKKRLKEVHRMLIPANVPVSMKFCLAVAVVMMLSSL